ncbi:MAG: hypothetical protein B7C24_09300 [Bacteroidetes bacterium 4572_77]|nr:MAG: hypothetical protein B7C24_09300 [Bacteroidetes bacterium 4572_77]
MKNVYLVFFTLLFSVLMAGNTEKTSIITQDLQSYMEQKDNSELIRVNLRFAAQHKLLNRYSEFKAMPNNQRRETAVQELKSLSKETQKELMTFLNIQNAQDYKLIHQFWISNVITCYASPALIEQLAIRSDLDRIDIDEERILIEELPESTPFDPPMDKGVDEITYNVSKVNADDVWALGYTGEGIIVSVIDCGVNYNHVDLSDHMWDGGDDYPLHGYDFYNNDNDPMDDNSHGTHCAGTVAGDGTAGSQTGMAPDATIMACKALNAGGGGNESDVWAAIEFSVEQGAHVISMSLGWPHSYNPDRETWRNTYDNALAAGVVAAVAAGNEGGSVNDPDDVRTPGDCPPPWLNPDQTLEGGISAVVCVGATNSGDGLASFSSRGPVTWINVDPFNDYPFNPELGLLRPDVSAPGVDIKSCDAFNNDDYTMMSGTSMATPGVAGVMALILSKNPDLSPAEICMILETTAVDLGDEGKDNLFGSGRIDALDAIENTSEQGPIYESHAFNDPNGNGKIEAGEAITIDMTMFNGRDVAYTNVEVTLSCESEFITMTDDVENYGDFAAVASVEVAEAFAFTAAENLPGLENIRFDISATDGTEVWTSSFNVISYGPKLSIGEMTIDDAAGNGNGRLDPGEEADLIFNIHNAGQTAAQDILLEIASSGNFINFETTTYTIEELAATGETQVAFSVIVSESAPIGAAEILTLDLSSGFYTDTKDFNVSIGLIVEDWETGDFTQFNWTFGGNSDWSITDNDPYEGTYCSKSGAIGNSASSNMQLEYESGSDGTISFFRKISTENNYDYLRFFIDGNEMDAWSGNQDWSEAVYDVSAGTHIFKWSYTKDGSTVGGDDAVYVDFIILPPLMLPSIVLDEDTPTICSGESYEITAEADNYESLAWTTAGDGSFDNEEILNPVYTPGTSDMENGMVVLTLTATGSNGDVSANIILSINELPFYSINENTDACINSVVEIPTEISGVGPYTMTIENIGDIEISETPYIFSWTVEQDSSFVILQVMDIIGCVYEEQTTVSVSARDLPIVDLGEDQTLCMNHEITLDAGNEGATYLWSTGEETQTIMVDTAGLKFLRFLGIL